MEVNNFNPVTGGLPTFQRMQINQTAQSAFKGKTYPSFGESVKFFEDEAPRSYGRQLRSERG